MSVTVIRNAAGRGDRAADALEAAAAFIRDPRNRDLIGQANPLERQCSTLEEVGRIARRIGVAAGHRAVLSFGEGVAYTAACTDRDRGPDGRPARPGLQAVAA